jgi:uncharacterized protein (TIGR03437 family)
MKFSRTIGIGVLAITAGSAAYGQDILRHYSIPGNIGAALPFFEWAQSATPDGSGGMFFFDFSKDSLHRFDSAAKELWSAPLSFGSSQGVVVSMAVASDGVYLAGQVNGALPGQTSVGSYDAFTVKYELNGKVLWTRQFGTPDGDFVRDIVRAPDGTYTVGVTRASVGGTIFIRRSDADGNEIWTRRFDQGNLEDIVGAAADSTGIYFVGMTTQANYNVLRKFDSAGNDLWTYQLDRFSIIVGIAPDEHGVYISFYPGGSGPIDTVRRLDLTGSEIWTRQIVTSYSVGSIAADATGFYLSGETNSALPGQCYAGQGDVFLMRFDAGGNPIWTREFGTAGTERAASISIGAAGVDVTSFDSSNGVFLTTIAKASPPVTDPRPKILWECVFNAANYLGGGVAPGEIVTVLGSGMGPSTLAPLQVSSDGHIPTSLSGARILFDGEPAPLIYVSDQQSSAIVPFDIAGKTSVNVQVEYNGVVSGAVNLPVFESRLGIFSFSASGAGQAAIVNEDGTINSPANPARRGSTVSIYATGGGLTEPAGADDQITGDGAPKLKSSLYVRLISDGSEDAPYYAAQVLYFGGAPRSVPGLVQINAQLPDSVPPGDAVPLYVGFLPTLGVEQVVTIAIR